MRPAQSARKTRPTLLYDYTIIVVNNFEFALVFFLFRFEKEKAHNMQQVIHISVREHVRNGRELIIWLVSRICTAHRNNVYNVYVKTAAG